MAPGDITAIEREHSVHRVSQSPLLRLQIYEFADSLKRSVTPNPMLLALLRSLENTRRAEQNSEWPSVTFPAEVGHGDAPPCLPHHGLFSAMVFTLPWFWVVISPFETAPQGRAAAQCP